MIMFLLLLYISTCPFGLLSVGQLPPKLLSYAPAMRSPAHRKA